MRIKARHSLRISSMGYEGSATGNYPSYSAKIEVPASFISRLSHGSYLQQLVKSRHKYLNGKCVLPNGRIGHYLYRQIETT